MVLNHQISDTTQTAAFWEIGTPGSNDGLVCVLEYQKPWSKLGSNSVWVNQILGRWLDSRIISWQIGSTAELGHLGHYCNWSPISDLGHTQIWVTIAIGLIFQFIGQLGHYSKFPSLRTRLFSKEKECKD